MTFPVAFEPALAPVAGCELCAQAGGELLWADAQWRVLRVADEHHPAFWRVVHREHVREFSLLGAGARVRCIDLVCAIEQVLLARLGATKVNLASLGNMTPHLHWHVIARFDWDARFPGPVWAPVLRQPAAAQMAQLHQALPGVDTAIVAALHAV
jgi:diadenosine tetraphosphate (Ap4A) HIT family hydrolase